MLYFLIIMSVQIILESLPVSSSAHVVLVEHLLQTVCANTSVAISNNTIISHFLHGPTIVILALFFLPRWLFLLLHINCCWNIVVKLACFIFIADGITALFFLFFKYMFSLSRFPLGIGFAITALILFSLRFCSVEKYQPLTTGKVALLGIVQGLALLPGVSRFGSTFVIACWLKIAPKKAFAFSFAMQWPLLLVAFLHSIFCMPAGFLVNKIQLYSVTSVLMIAVSSLIAFGALYWVQTVICAKKFWKFSFYMLFSFLLWVCSVCFF